MKQALTVIIEKEAEKIFDFLEIRKVVEGWCAEKAAFITGQVLLVDGGFSLKRT